MFALYNDSMSAKENLIEAAMRLSESDRFEVAQALMESLEGPPDPAAQGAWAQEIERRIKLIDSGQARFIPWEEARRRIMGADDATASH
jgi:putative addiction module component (TIGR02574 family)